MGIFDAILKNKAGPYSMECVAGIDDLGDVLAWTGVQAEGRSKADDMKRVKLLETLDDFEKDQMELNKKLRQLKQHAQTVAQCKGTTDVELMKKKAAANRAYTPLKNEINGKLADLEAKLKDDGMKTMAVTRKNDEKGYAVGSEKYKEPEVSVDALEQRSQVLELFRSNITATDEVFGKMTKTRSQSDEMPAALAMDELGNLPDLDPLTWENYAKFVKKDEEIDEVLLELLEVNKDIFEKARKFKDRGKLEDARIASMTKTLEDAKDTSDKALTQAQKVITAIDGSGPGKMCVYVVMFCLIIAVVYGIYTFVDGDDPCSDYNNKSCH